MDREMWILWQVESSLTASAEALGARLQVSPRTITNTDTYTHLPQPPRLDMYYSGGAGS